MTSMGTLGEREQVWRQHQQGAVPGVMGSRPATLPPHRPSSPGTAAASEPSMSSTSGFAMATSGRGTKLSSWERSIFCRNTWRRAAGPIPRPELGLLLPLPSAHHMLPQHPWEGMCRDCGTARGHDTGSSPKVSCPAASLGQDLR